jgi:hypothetical protein
LNDGCEAFERCVPNPAGKLESRTGIAPVVAVSAMVWARQPLRFWKPPPELLGQRDFENERKLAPPLALLFPGVFGPSLFANEVRD